jgi:hypothetical protein
VWKDCALVPNKAAQERHGDEAEEDDEKHGSADDTLGFWTKPGQNKHRIRATTNITLT